MFADIAAADSAQAAPDLASATTTMPTQESSISNAQIGGETAIPIAMDPVALVISECITVSSAMRKHSRWAHSSVAAILGGATAPQNDESNSSSSRNAAALGTRLIPSKPASKTGSPPKEDYALQSRWGLRGKKGKSLQDNPLMSAFTRLRTDLKDCKDIRTFDAPSLLHPFLQVIRSSSTSAPITSLALIAITKFFSYNIITRHSPRASMALQFLSAAVTHCRFEATDSAADEIVLLRILKLMEDMMTRPEGELLGDESVCEMMETGLSMCCQVRLSEVLRRSAEMAMVNMCQMIFQRLSVMKDEVVPEEESVQPEQTADDKDAVTMAPSVDGNTVIPQTPSTMGSDAIDPEGRNSRGSTPTPNSPPAEATTTAIPANMETPEDEYVEVKAYSIPSIRELFRVLIDLLDPHNPIKN
ncbi:hypothetical protein KEM56_004021 [Ascosphaera pollenicola]|nr:hypothetical protein KEM56_004021 [Ascosphaera pollenicola]